MVGGAIGTQYESRVTATCEEIKISIYLSRSMTFCVVHSLACVSSMKRCLPKKRTEIILTSLLYQWEKRSTVVGTVKLSAKSLSWV